MTIKGTLSAGSGLRIECIDTYAGDKFSPKLVIGDGVVMNQSCHIGCINSITIGDKVLMGSRVLISDHSHGYLSEEKQHESYLHRQLYSKGRITIHNNVWLGDNVCVLAGVTIGEGSIVGANSVVTHDIPAYCLAVGSPARIVKQIKV